MNSSQRPSATRFDAPIERCDVLDRVKLQKYRDKWTEWMDWYESRPDEPHTLQNQMHHMFFYDLSYRAVVSARTYTDASIASSSRAPVLTHLLDQGYVVGQVLAIERLLDGSKDVISLPRFLNDVEKHCLLITRENYVAGDGSPYDYASCLQEALPRSMEAGIWGLKAPGLSHALRSKERHECFDILANTSSPMARTRDDLIEADVFSKLKGWLRPANVDKLRILRNKTLAHAADPTSRGAYTYEGVKLTEIDEAHQAIVRVERGVVDHILDYGVARDVIPMAPLGIFEELKHPYATSEALEAMYVHWNELEVKRNSWKDTVWKELSS